MSMLYLIVGGLLVLTCILYMGLFVFKTRMVKTIEQQRRVNAKVQATVSAVERKFAPMTGK